VRLGGRSSCLALLAAVLVAGAWSAPSAAQEDLPEAFEGEAKDIHLWPVLVSYEKPSGGRLSFFLFLWHHNRASSGETASWHFLNWFQGRNYKLFVPFAYSVGQPGAKHRGFIPFYFQGPGYKTAPLALTFWKEHEDGANTLLVAPFYHRTREKDGSLRHAHFLNYAQGPDYKVLFPFAYSAGPEGAKHKGVVPFYFQGPDYKAAPGAFTFWWKDRRDDSDHLWVTPAFHRTRNADGSLRGMHVLNYFQGEDYKVLFPLAYSVGPEGAKHRGVVPFYFQGPDYKVLFPLAYSVGPDGAKHKGVVPFYFQGPDYRVLFPLAYSVGPDGAKHKGVVPFYFQGPGYKAAPGALTFRWKDRRDDSDHLWVTPAFHRTRNADGTLRDMHFLNYAQGPDYKVFFPLAYSVGPDGAKHKGVVPFYFQGPGYKAAPGALTFWWKDRRDDSDHLWVTPAFHRTREEDGSLRDMHLLNYAQGPDYKVLFPLAYSVGAPGQKHRGVVPLAFWGPGYFVSPPLLPLYVRTKNAHVSPALLSGWWRRPDGTEWTWITPLFHKTRNPDGSLKHMHALNYFQGPDYKVFFPLAYSVGAPGLRHQGFIPFYFGGPGYKVVPPALTYWRKNADGSDTLWATPFFHRTREGDGSLRDMHFLNYAQGPDYKVLFPLAYSVGAPGLKHRGIVPLAFWGPGYFASPVLAPLYIELKHARIVPVGLSAWWRRDDGTEWTWITPFFHKTRNPDGSLRHMHAANYFQGENYKVLFPLAYSVGQPGLRHQGFIPFYFGGPGYKVVPPALTYWRKNADGSDSLWATPLFHRTRNADGTLRNMHALNYFQGPDYKVFFPLAYSVGQPGQRHQGFIPFYFGGPGYKVVPPALTFWRKNADGSDTLWATPLFHRTRDADGTLRDMHFLNYAQGPNYKVLFPLAYSVGPDGAKHKGVVPFYFQGPGYKAAPGALTFWWKDRRDDSDHLWVTPAFHRTRNADGSLRDMHALNYFQGPNYKVFFPLAYSVGPPGLRHQGFIPFYFGGPGYKAVPPALTFWRRNADGSDTLWATPLFHRTREGDGSLRDMHLLNYAQGPDYKVLFPFAYSVGAPGQKHRGVVPLAFWGPDYFVSPPLLPLYVRTKNAQVSPALLTGWWRRPDGTEWTWITPLFHKTRNPDGSLRHMHALNYFQGPDYKVFFPLAYSVGAPGQKHRGIVPLAFWGPGYFVAPPIAPVYFRARNAHVFPLALSGRWRTDDGARQTWITPFFHETRNADGTLRHRHFLNYVEGKNYKVFFPLAYSVGEPGKKHKAFLPLYYQGPKYKVLFPLAYSVGEPGRKHQGFIPFFFKGPNYKVIPLLLSGSWRKGRGSGVIVGPLWWSYRPAPGTPIKFQVLGGLFARDCNYVRGTYRYRILWLIPIGRRRRFTPPPVARE
jgi:hypothetical protein